MIKRLLVANRGEVAVRVMATAAVLGVETVAVYPADDAACGHVARAEVAVELPGTGVAAYLDIDAILAAAAGAGCDTLHPGYGFLSERPELSARCAAAGLRFIGPDPEALAGISMPPSAAASGNAARRSSLSSPRWISRRISSPTTKKKIVITPSLIQK